MKKEDILRHVGSMQQLAYARRISYDEGRARGLNAVEVKNGPMRFVVMLDKCLDISELSWRGENLVFISKPGLNGRNQFDTHGSEAQRSIMGGLFFTCGFENICPPYTDSQGREYPMHGRMRTSPAEHVSIECFWEEEDYVIRVSGDIREAELFGENLLLHRVIETRYGSAQISVRDSIYNEAFRSEPLMLMYHCNVGYPLLNENSRLILPSKAVEPRDEISRENLGTISKMDKPKDNEFEYVYLHELAADKDGMSFAAIVDSKRDFGLRISFDSRKLPYFGQWKSTGSGDYVMGLEPGNSKIYGRAYHDEKGELHHIGAGQSEEYELCFEVLEGREQISELCFICDELLK